MVLGISIPLLAISPYYMIKESKGDLKSSEIKVREALTSNGFKIIGTYNPGNYKNYRVIVYTSDELVDLCSSVNDRGILAAALKIGIRERDDDVQISMINPEYLFYAYLRNEMENTQIKNTALAIDKKSKSAMKSVGSDFIAFGGDLSAKQLENYKYMMGMPKFDDPVILKEFGSQAAALETINKNLASEKGKMVKVYELSDNKGNATVIGVGLLDPDKGENHFLSIIGKKHLAAMPYELVVVNGKVTMLHGRFRFASHWPELTMGTFTKIMSSPGDVEDFLKSLTE